MKLIIFFGLLMYGYYTYMSHLTHIALSLEKQVTAPYQAIAANPEPDLRVSYR